MPREPGTTISESRHHGVLVSTNRIEVFPDQPFDVRSGFRDAAENLTAASLRFDIANPHLEVMFFILAAPDEGGIHGDRDRWCRRRRPDRGTVGGAAPAFRVRRRKVLGSIPASTGSICSSRSAPTRYVIRADRCARSPVPVSSGNAMAN
jgi:hypothetical protein